MGTCINSIVYGQLAPSLLFASEVAARDALAGILERETRAPGGSIYGTSSNGARAAFLRPANVSPVPGLYLVGGSAHPGGGLPLVGMGAEIVAELIGRA